MTKKIQLPADSPMTRKSFLFGVAAASFQIEGGADTRLESIWDRFCAKPDKIADGSDGLVACDHFNRWEADIDLIEQLGVDAYRLSVSWPRVMHKDGTLNSEGADFYVRILDRLAEKNIKAFVTLYHWDLPQHLEDQGGWLNRDTAYKFAEYVDAITKVFGDRVHTYTTLNEPFCSAYLGYGVGVHAPGLSGPDEGRIAAHHLLLGHGLAMEVLSRNSPDTDNGIVFNFSPYHPETDSEADKIAAKAADDLFSQWFIQPVMDGKYPDIIDTMSAAEKPVICDGDMAIISKPIDYIGINYYTREIIRASDTARFEKSEAGPLPRTDIGWEIYSDGLTEVLLDMHNRYKLPPIYITENGAAMKDVITPDGVQDHDRLGYYQNHLMAVHNAIKAGVDIRGYFAWSLMDNFEWAEGYAKRFGIVYVDYETQERTIKASGYAYRDFVGSRTKDVIHHAQVG